MTSFSDHRSPAGCLDLYERDPVTISAIEHYLYCPRQYALISVEGVWQDNLYTTEGSLGHARADSGTTTVAGRVETRRSLTVWSDSLGLIGRLDILERHLDTGEMVPVEYKRVARPDHRRGWQAASAQLCAQAICLEEMLAVTIRRGFLYSMSSRRRHEITLGQSLRDLVTDTVQRIRELLEAGRVPSAVNDARCRRCSLQDACLPTLTCHAGGPTD